MRLIWLVIFSVQCYSRLHHIPSGHRPHLLREGGSLLGSVGDLWPGLWSQQLPGQTQHKGDPALLKYRDYVTANATHRSRTRYMSPHQTIGHFLLYPAFLWPKVRVKPTCKWGDVTSGSVSAIVWTACRQVWRWKLCQPSFIAGPSIRYGAHGAVMVTLSAPPSLSCHTVSISTVHRPADHSSVPHSRNLLTLRCALGTSQWHYASIKMLKC